MNVFEQLIQELYFHCEWAIEWQERQRIVELSFQLRLMNPNKLPFRDSNNQSSSGDQLTFTTKVIIYDTRVTELAWTDYITAIPVDYHEGIAYGECLAIIKYLKNLTSSAHIQWEEFIHDSNQTEFAIEWDEREYHQIKNRLIESNRYSETTIYFPSDNFKLGVH